MNTGQQYEALDYFKRHAHDWANKANISSQYEVNVIRQRNDFVLKVINEREKTELVLDVGSGTGDLVCEIAQRGIRAIGVDFSDEMIQVATSKKKDSKLEKASFRCCSIFDFCLEPSHYDVISANGFIEYISYEELYQFLDISWKALTYNGSLILSSRNRLFNIFSLNKFTQEEIEDTNITALILEAIQLVALENVNDLKGLTTAPLQKEGKEHEDTGIKVSTRYQFTPAQLVNILEKQGFEAIKIFPIHVHGITPKFKHDNPNVHGAIANLLQNYAYNNLCLIPQSSSFMIESRKI